MKRVPSLVGAACAVLACSPSSSATDAGAEDASAALDAGPSALEVFADVGASSEGIALGRRLDGASVLYVGTSDDRIVTVTPEGVVADFVTIDSPVGLAVRRDQSLVVCASQPAAMGGASAIFSVTRDGVISTLVASGPGGVAFMLTNFVLEAPDGSIVFSDSAADALYRADADGSNVARVASVSFANGLAFSPGGDTLYVAAWDTPTVFALSFDRATGRYGAPRPAHEGVNNVDGLIMTSTGALVLVTTAAGVQLADLSTPTAPTRSLLSMGELTLPANGVFGDASFGPHDIYLTSLARHTIAVLHTDVGGL